MSTFLGILSEIPGISIDRFGLDNLSSNVFFLSHCHTDHMVGLDTDEFISCLRNGNKKYIYMSMISSIILKNKIPALKDFIKPLEVLETYSIPLLNSNVAHDDVVKDDFLQTILIPAAHCPGSVMFLFQKSDDVRILYTGDFRLSPEVLPKIKQLNNPNGTPKTIQTMYFDSTFWNEKYLDFPRREDSCKVICGIIEDWIARGKDYIVSLNIPARYGSEYVYMEIYKRFQIPIHVTDEVYNLYRRITDMDGCITLDSKLTQIHSCEYKARPISCRDKISNLKLRFIRPSALRWDYFDTNNSEIFTVSKNENLYYVCYSSHSSFNELKSFINYFKPQLIKPCVVPLKDSSDFYSSITSFSKTYLSTSLNCDKNINDICLEYHCNEINVDLLSNKMNLYQIKRKDISKLENKTTEIIKIDSSSEGEDDNSIKQSSILSKLINARESPLKNNVFRKKSKFF